MQGIITQLSRPLRLLVIDDDAEVLEMFSLLLEDAENIEYKVLGDASVLDREITAFMPHVVVTDLKMPDVTGIDVLCRVKQLNPEIEVIVMTAHASTSEAIEAMKQGAYDFVTRPFGMDELVMMLEKIVHARVLERQNLYLKARLERFETTISIRGISDFAKHVKAFVDQVADSTASVFISGESGTGKSMLAQQIHCHSSRADAPFVTIECASIPGELLESELFGYKKGAFTGADQDKPGRIELADSGTLFLDEIGDMPLNLQAKMLRVLQERELTRVGDVMSIPVDVRVIAATNKNIEYMIREGAFREDLYYRLNVLPFTMLPLRERKADIPDLVEMLLEKLCRRNGEKARQLAPEMLDQLVAHDWPGNIRELENTLERALILNKGGIIDQVHIQQQATGNGFLTPEAVRQMELAPEGLSLGELLAVVIEKAEALAGTKKAAAALLKVSGDVLEKMQSMLKE